MTIVEENTANTWEEKSLCSACGNVTTFLCEDILGAIHEQCEHCGDELVHEYEDFNQNEDDRFYDDTSWEEPWWETDLDEEYDGIDDLDGSGWD